MVSCHKATRYVLKANLDGLPHYLVKLTGKHISQFEIQNSLVHLDSFNDLLLFLECQLYIDDPLDYTDSGTVRKEERKRDLPVPPFDVVLVLLTLVSASEHYLEPQLRLNDPYNLTRSSLNKRAIKLLECYVNILKDFNTTLYSQYDLELLRCQFFIGLDSLTCRSRLSIYGKGNTFSTNSTDGSNNRGVLIKNPYKSYVSVFDEKDRILNNLMIHILLNQPDRFRNMIMWTLYNSLSDNDILYTDVINIWIPFMNIILDVYDLRQKYFLRNEITKVRKVVFVQRLMTSPLSQFFSFIENFGSANLSFANCIFTNCNYKDGEKSDSDYSNPLYFKEDRMVRTFVPRIEYPMEYKLKKSMQLRKKLLASCFQLLYPLPKKHFMTLLRMSSSEIISNVVQCLCNFKDIHQFEAFFEIYDLRSELAFMPLICEKTIEQLTRPTQETSFNLVDSIISLNAFIKEWERAIKVNFDFIVDNIDERFQFFRLKKIEVCLSVLFRFFELLMKKTLISESKYMDCVVLKLIDIQSKMNLLKNKFTDPPIPNNLFGFNDIISKYS